MLNRGKSDLPRNSRAIEVSPLGLLQRHMNDFFDDFWGVAPSVKTDLSKFSPKIDIEDHDNELRVTADLPGIKKEDVQLSLTDDALVIKGERKSEHREGNGKSGRRYVERSYGMFERIIPLSAEVESDKVDATFKDGVLTVVLPKSQNARGKTKAIDIK